MKRTTTPKPPAELEALPEDFDPMEMAAFLEGESNTKLVKGLTGPPCCGRLPQQGWTVPCTPM